MNQIAKLEHMPTEPHGALTPMDMLDRAVSSGASVEVMEKLLGLQERWEATQARKAFDAAMSAAKAEMPTIVKNREVDFKTSAGRTNYRFEDLAGIASQVDPVLARHGLIYRFRTETGDQVKVTCIISHRDGHSEENSLIAPRDASGNKNAIQAIGSTVTYLQRYTLKAALGLAASHDDDGHAASGRADEPEYVTPEQVSEIRSKLDEVGASAARLCRALNVESLSQIPAARFQQVMRSIVKKGQDNG